MVVVGSDAGSVAKVFAELDAKVDEDPGTKCAAAELRLIGNEGGAE